MKNDKRIIRTNKMIKEAFLKLLSEKKYQSITVQNIADEAFINRNTFYLHFIDKEDLLERYTSECLDELVVCLEEINIDAPNDDYIFKTIQNVFLAIEKRRDFYRIMMNDINLSYFVERLEAILVNQILLSVDDTQEETKFYIEFIVSGFIGVVRLYLKNNSFSSEKLSDFLFKYVSANPSSLLLENMKIKTV